MASAKNARRQHSYYGDAYVDGSAAPELEPEISPRPGRQERSERRAREEIRVRRNQERALQMNLPYLIIMMVAAVCALYICVNYIQVQSNMTTRMDTIKVLEEQVETLRSKNDALETRINTYVDLDYVYKVATEELGMVYANKDQVLMYDKTESEYVRQNEDIPSY